MLRRIGIPVSGTLIETGYEVYRFPHGEHVKGYIDENGRYYEMVDAGFEQVEWFAEPDNTIGDIVFGETHAIDFGETVLSGVSI